MIDQQTMIDRARSGHCPGCDAQRLVAGPWGGASRNVLCKHCLRRWNLHGIAYGIVAVDSEGTCTPDDITFCQRTYPNDQPFTGVHHGPETNRDIEA